MVFQDNHSAALDGRDSRFDITVAHDDHWNTQAGVMN